MEGPGTRDAPRELASLSPALPVEKEKRGSRVPGRCWIGGLEQRYCPPPDVMCLRRAGRAVQARSPETRGLPDTGSDCRNGAITAAALACCRTSPFGSARTFTLTCIDPAPLNSDQLPSCGMDERIIRRGGGV